jgi:hypothetical protein
MLWLAHNYEYMGAAMEQSEKDHELGEHAERLVGQIESDLKYDEEGKSYFEKSSILNLVFRVADFMRQLSKRI